MSPSSQPTCSHKRRCGQNKGQVVVEYVLLLMVAVALAAILVAGLINRGDNQGALITGWTQILNFITNDKADDIAP